MADTTLNTFNDDAVARISKVVTTIEREAATPTGREKTFRAKRAHFLVVTLTEDLVRGGTAEGTSLAGRYVQLTDVTNVIPTGKMVPSGNNVSAGYDPVANIGTSLLPKGHYVLINGDCATDEVP